MFSVKLENCLSFTDDLTTRQKWVKNVLDELQKCIKYIWQSAVETASKTRIICCVIYGGKTNNLPRPSGGLNSTGKDVHSEM